MAKPTASTPHGVNGTLAALNDWPNDIGFEVVQDQTDPVELKVSGKIPAYAAGILYRTGPGGHQIGTNKNTTFSFSHWFDGLAQTHRFELAPPIEGDYVTRVTYNSRHTVDELIENVRKTGEFASMTFGQQRDPCESFFKKVMSSFQAVTGREERGPSGHNIGVTIQANMPMPGQKLDGTSTSSSGAASKINHLWQKTDFSSLQEIDPTTLVPIRVTDHPKLHPDLKGPFTGAHSRTDPVTGDWYNYNLEVGRQAVYRVFSVSAKTGKTTILATLSGGGIRAAYLHAIMLTENHVVLCLFNAYYAKGGLKVLWTRNMLDAMEFDPGKKNVWLVIDRHHGRGLVGKFESDPFFAFHPVNSWEQPSETEPEPGKVDIIADIPTYENLDILKRFYYHNMKASTEGARNFVGEKGETSRPSLTRWKLPGVGSTTIATTTKARTAERMFAARKDDTPELPTFNPLYAMKPSRYIYGVCDRGNSSFLDGLIKYDTQTNTSVTRIVHAQSPGEPIFLPDPHGTEEDDGVCLSVVLDGTEGKSYLLVLNAKTFDELGRAEMETVVPFGFHGTHVA